MQPSLSTRTRVCLILPLNTTFSGQFIHQVIVNIPSSGFTDDLLLTGAVYIMKLTRCPCSQLSFARRRKGSDRVALCGLWRSLQLWLSPLHLVMLSRSFIFLARCPLSFSVCGFGCRLIYEQKTNVAVAEAADFFQVRAYESSLYTGIACL